MCGADPLSNDDVLDLLTSLVEKSLVLIKEQKDGGRYGVLETIRDYAREKLASKEANWTQTAQQRHIAQHYFVVVGREAQSRSARGGASRVDPAHRDRP